MTSSKDELITRQADTLSEEEIEAAYQRWQAPKMVSVSDVEDPSLLTLEGIESLQKQAELEGYKIGFEKGEKAGIEAGEQQIIQRVSAINDLIDALNEPIQQLDQDLEKDLISLVITMTRQLVRRELKTEPDHVIGAMRAALSVLPVNDRKLKVFLNPQDVDLVKTGLAIDHDDSRWQWVEDPLITRGGVRLETADTTIDATVEARLSSVINKLLGEERGDDSGE
jgi:flagellar assembly protein FliH